MKKILLSLLITLFISTNSSYAKERFIPIELWLGIPSTGSNDLKFYEVNNKQHGGKLKVSGPIDWKNEVTGKTIKVYERKRGSKVQLFTITNNGQCLGRVWDSRKRKRGVVIAIDNGCKFPLGNWKEGETRDFFSAYNWPKKKSGGSSTSKRTGMKKTLTIKKLGDEKDCLTFRWQLTIIGGKKSGKVIDYNDYTYCPNKGFTKLVSRK